MLNILRNGEKGITGLETAIILIAFVVVAAVFAYTVLSAGVYATQTSQQAIYSGLHEASGTMQIKGSVVGYDDDLDENINSLKFVVACSAAGGAVNLTPPIDAEVDGIPDADSEHRTVICYTDAHQRLPDIAWDTMAVGYTDGDDLLEEGEQVEITVSLTALTTPLYKNTDFTLEVRPAEGSTLIIARHVPAAVDAFTILQ
jgi:flagellin FlaB